MGVGAVVVVVAPVVELVLCLTSSRAVTTALARILRSRRGRDITLVLVMLVAVLPQLVRVWLLSNGNRAESVDLHPAVAVLRWTPPGLAGHAVADAARGRLGLAVGQLALAAVTIVPLLWWWARSLDAALTTAEATSSHRPAAAGQGPGLYPRFARFLPLSRAGAVAARELRYMSRDPRRRVQLLSGLLVPLFAFIPLIA